MHEITLALGAEALVNGKLAASREDARAKLQAVLDNGKAYELFEKMVVAQGGSTAFEQLPKAAVVKPVLAQAAGYIQSMNTRDIGVAVINLGGGRRVASDAIDHSVGFDEILPIGARVEADTPLAMVHAKDEASWQAAAQAYRNAVSIGQTQPESRPMVYETLAG